MTACRPTIDVVICTIDRPDDLRRCLESLRFQTEPAERIIVVDAGANPARLPAEPPVELVASRPGLTTQRNAALERVWADLVAFFDDDIELEPDALARLREWFAAHNDCSGVGGNITNDPHRPTLSRVFRSVFALANDDGVLRRSGDAAYLRHPVRPTRVDSVGGGCMVFRARSIAELRFDEVLRGYSYMEDVDFSLRASLRGELWMVPDVRVIHRRTRTKSGSKAPERAYVAQVFAYSAYLFGKHRARFGLGRVAFARRMTGRAIAYLLLSARHGTLEPLVGMANGLLQVPAMLRRGEREDV